MTVLCLRPELDPRPSRAPPLDPSQRERMLGQDWAGFAGQRPDRAAEDPGGADEGAGKPRGRAHERRRTGCRHATQQRSPGNVASLPHLGQGSE